jgi:hypothetical protein
MGEAAQGEEGEELLHMAERSCILHYTAAFESCWRVSRADALQISSEDRSSQPFRSRRVWQVVQCFSGRSVQVQRVSSVSAFLQK